MGAMRRVLIVDDDAKVCETLDRYLTHAGYATASALDGRRALEAVRAFAPDLILSIRYGAIFRAPVIAVPRLGVLNLHAGVLPPYRGVIATFRALMHGDTEVGCTLHFITDATIDTGPVVGIARVPVHPGRSLLWHVLSLYPPGIAMVAAALAQLARGATPATTPQGEGAYYSYPTAEEWAEFARRGWQVATAADLYEVFGRYVSMGLGLGIGD
jgi:methionyl-tRNA formyltransferase